MNLFSPAAFQLSCCRVRAVCAGVSCVCKPCFTVAKTKHCRRANSHEALGVGILTSQIQACMRAREPSCGWHIPCNRPLRMAKYSAKIHMSGLGAVQSVSHHGTGTCGRTCTSWEPVHVTADHPGPLARIHGASPDVLQPSYILLCSCPSSNTSPLRPGVKDLSCFPLGKQVA